MKRQAAGSPRTISLLAMIGLVTGLVFLAYAQAAAARPAEGPTAAGAGVSVPGTDAKLQPRTPPSIGAQARATRARRSASIVFIENVGQFDPRAGFQVRGAQGTVYLADDAIWHTLLERREAPSDDEERQRRHEPHAEEVRRGVNLRVSFVGANPHPQVMPFSRLDTKVSYFIGNDPEKWYPDVPVWGGVRYVNLYPGIHLELTSEGGRWQERWVVQEGADLSSVRFRVDGADAVAVDEQGRLNLSTEVGALVQERPEVVFESPDGRSDTGTLQISVSGSEVRLAPGTSGAPGGVGRKSAPGAGSTALIVDTSQSGEDDLIYSTFLGDASTDYASDIAVDNSGAAYVTGITYSSDFPTTTGAYSTTLLAPCDVRDQAECGGQRTRILHLPGWVRWVI